MFGQYREGGLGSGARYNLLHVFFTDLRVYMLHKHVCTQQDKISPQEHASVIPASFHIQRPL